MAFGISIGDIILLLQLAKNTVQDCRCAPNGFAEASRVSQSLYLMLEGVKTEYQNQDSLLHKDDRTPTDFAIHFKNCETSMKPLADLIAKHKRLGTSDIRVVDRMRFPKKDYLEYRGNLAFYTARLSEFLQMIGLGSLGRIEHKVEDIKGHLPKLMNKLDQMCAEFRIMGDKESLLSDHTDDEKFVWKTFRSKLNDAGFKSNVLREHESAIFLRIRELTECGLLDADGSSSLWTDDAISSTTAPIHRLPFHPSSMDVHVESDAESEKTITPKPSIRTLRSRKSSDSVRSSKRYTSQPITPEPRSQRPTGSFSKNLSSSHGSLKHQASTSAVPAKSSDKPRLWRNAKGEAMLKGTLSTASLTKEKVFITVIDADNQDVLIPRSNLSREDLEYVKTASERATQSLRAAPDPDKELPPKDDTPQTTANKVNDLENDAINVSGRTHPEILVGKRTRMLKRSYFRPEGYQLPRAAPYCARSLLTSDLLPNAASIGDLARVRRLLALGERIESKGPESWTENTGSGESSSTKRHSYPETTALYRAAYAGWFDVVHFLIKEGADVNTRDGYDGNSLGKPILFGVISNGNEKIARLLLEYEAKMEAFGSYTALHAASSQPKRALVQLVLDYGAFINAKDGSRQTPLYLASVRGFASIVQLLLEEGARTDIITSEGRSALYKASGTGRDDIAELLLRYGADPTVGRGRFGETTIYKAAWYNHLDVVDLLLDFEANVNIQNNAKMESYRGIGEKIFHGFVAGLSEKHAIMNAWGKTALHAAAYQGHEEMVEVLLQAGADLEAAGNDGLTPMYLAAQQKHQSVVQTLLKAGAQLETERHDPVLALLNERNTARSSESKAVVKKSDKRKELAKMGTSDTLVGIVADWTREWSSSRRMNDKRRTKRIP